MIWRVETAYLTDRRCATMDLYEVSPTQAIRRKGIRRGPKPRSDEPVRSLTAVMFRSPRVRWPNVSAIWLGSWRLSRSPILWAGRPSMHPQCRCSGTARRGHDSGSGVSGQGRARCVVSRWVALRRGHRGAGRECRAGGACDDWMSPNMVEGRPARRPSINGFGCQLQPPLPGAVVLLQRRRDRHEDQEDQEDQKDPNDPKEPVSAVASVFMVADSPRRWKCDDADPHRYRTLFQGRECEGLTAMSSHETPSRRAS